MRDNGGEETIGGRYRGLRHCCSSTGEVGILGSGPATEGHPALHQQLPSQSLPSARLSRRQRKVSSKSAELEDAAAEAGSGFRRGRERGSSAPASRTAPPPLLQDSAAKPRTLLLVVPLLPLLRLGCAAAAAAMPALSPWCPQGALLLLVLLLLLELGLAERGGGPASAQGPSGALSLPLVQVLLRQAPPSSRPHRQAGGPPLRYMLDLYRSVADRHGRPRKKQQLTTNTVRLVRPFAKTRQPGAGPRLVWSLDYRLEVHVPRERLVKATVVYSQTHSSAHGLLWCTAELLPCQGTEHQVGPPPTHTKVALPSSSSSAGDTWVEMDLSAYLQPWTWAAQKSRVLQLSHACSSMGQLGGRSPDPDWENAVTLEDPFLLLYLNDSGRGHAAELGDWEALPFYSAPPGNPAQMRKARQAGELALDLPSSNRSKQRDAQSGECALHPFRVSFSQLGWDHWIIAPHWYRPQYCKGSCPRVLRFGFHSPNHAIVQNFINELVDQTVPRPSCVPYEYRPISVLMMEQNGNILYKVYEDMIAKSCTCR
ncbi:bone morphogenetic protein 15 [Tiliqua scincoides]|uniref:bone morphogenetic protein 15 n=1 Tax=Tiliqua scincoides TaxID=71010 RepID=UPI003462B591